MKLVSLTYLVSKTKTKEHFLLFLSIVLPNDPLSSQLMRALNLGVLGDRLDALPETNRYIAPENRMVGIQSFPSKMAYFQVLS